MRFRRAQPPDALPASVENPCYRLVCFAGPKGRLIPRCTTRRFQVRPSCCQGCSPRLLAALSARTPQMQRFPRLCHMAPSVEPVAAPRAPRGSSWRRAIKLLRVDVSTQAVDAAAAAEAALTAPAQIGAIMLHGNDAQAALGR